MRSNKARISIEVETCMDCHLHSWCSRHDESKYDQNFNQLKSKIASGIPQASVNRNSIPVHYKKLNQKSSVGENKYYDEKNQTFIQYPRFGSFQVYVDGMLIFSKLKSNMWPKHDKIAKLISLIAEEKQNGGNVQKYSLDHRLQNDCDEDFIDTYKAALIKELIPKKSASNPHGNNSSVFDSPIRKNFVMRKMNTGSGSRHKKQMNMGQNVQKSRQIEGYSRGKGQKLYARPASKQIKKRGLVQSMYEDQGLLYKNVSDSSDRLHHEKNSPAVKQKKMIPNKNTPLDIIKVPSSETKPGIRKFSNKNILKKNVETHDVYEAGQSSGLKQLIKQNGLKNSLESQDSPQIQSPVSQFKKRSSSKKIIAKDRIHVEEKNEEKECKKIEEKIGREQKQQQYDNQFILEEQTGDQGANDNSIKRNNQQVKSSQRQNSNEGIKQQKTHEVVEEQKSQQIEVSQKTNTNENKVSEQHNVIQNVQTKEQVIEEEEEKNSQKEVLKQEQLGEQTQQIKVAKINSEKCLNEQLEDEYEEQFEDDNENKINQQQNVLDEPAVLTLPSALQAQVIEQDQTIQQQPKQNTIQNSKDNQHKQKQSFQNKQNQGEQPNQKIATHHKNQQTKSVQMRPTVSQKLQSSFEQELIQEHKQIPLQNLNQNNPLGETDLKELKEKETEKQKNSENIDIEGCGQKREGNEMETSKFTQKVEPLELETRFKHISIQNDAKLPKTVQLQNIKDEFEVQQEKGHQNQSNSKIQQQPIQQEKINHSLHNNQKQKQKSVKGSQKSFKQSHEQIIQSQKVEQKQDNISKSENNKEVRDSNKNLNEKPIQKEEQQKDEKSIRASISVSQKNQTQNIGSEQATSKIIQDHILEGNTQIIETHLKQQGSQKPMNENRSAKNSQSAKSLQPIPSKQEVNKLDESQKQSLSHSKSNIKVNEIKQDASIRNSQHLGIQQELQEQIVQQQNKIVDAEQEQVLLAKSQNSNKLVSDHQITQKQQNKQQQLNSEQPKIQQSNSLTSNQINEQQIRTPVQLLTVEIKDEMEKEEMVVEWAAVFDNNQFKLMKLSDYQTMNQNMQPISNIQTSPNLNNQPATDQFINQQSLSQQQHQEEQSDRIKSTSIVGTQQQLLKDKHQAVECSKNQLGSEVQPSINKLEVEKYVDDIGKDAIKQSQISNHILSDKEIYEHQQKMTTSVLKFETNQEKQQQKVEEVKQELQDKIKNKNVVEQENVGDEFVSVRQDKQVLEQQIEKEREDKQQNIVHYWQACRVNQQFVLVQITQKGIQKEDKSMPIEQQQQYEAYQNEFSHKQKSQIEQSSKQIGNDVDTCNVKPQTHCVQNIDSQKQSINETAKRTSEISQHKQTQQINQNINTPVQQISEINKSNKVVKSQQQIDQQTQNKSQVHLQEHKSEAIIQEQPTNAIVEQVINKDQSQANQQLNDKHVNILQGQAKTVIQQPEIRESKNKLKQQTEQNEQAKHTKAQQKLLAESGIIKWQAKRQEQNFELIRKIELHEKREENKIEWVAEKKGDQFLLQLGVNEMGSQGGIVVEQIVSGQKEHKVQVF